MTLFNKLGFIYLQRVILTDDCWWGISWRNVSWITMFPEKWFWVRQEINLDCKTKKKELYLENSDQWKSKV